MNEINTTTLIQQTEKRLKAILGDKFYEEIKEFFRQFILASNVDKLLITRRAYILYKIFYKIISISEAQDDKKAKDAIATRGDCSTCVYTTHSIPLLLGKSEKRPLLIVDDVIVNGRTIVQVTHKFQNVDKDWKIYLWCLRCNEEAAFVQEIQPYLKHVFFVTPYEWEIISDRLTDAVIMANIGYVSFLNTYWVSDNGYEKIFEYLSSNQYDKRSHTIETHSSGSEGKYSLKCDYFFIDQYDNQKYPVAIRLYKTDWSNLVIPYVYLPTLSSEKLSSMLKEYRQQSDVTTCSINVFSEYLDTKNDKESFNLGIGILLYQSIVNFLSDSYLKDIFRKCLGNDFNAQIALCFNPVESFPADMNEGSFPAENIADTGHEDWDQISKEIEVCKRMLSSVEQKTDSFLETMKKYFAKVREEDDRRANQKMERLYGISINDIMNCFVTSGVTNSSISTSNFYLDLLYLWDTGMASCVILATWNQEKKCNEFSEFIRHGEQAFRAIYSIYPDEYSVLRRFAEISDSYSDREILPFVRYYGQYSGSSRILHFAEKIEFETFFADCMAISPESVGAKLQKQEIDKIIKTYMSSI